MSYILTDGASTIVTYPYSIGMLRRDNPNVSFPPSPTNEQLADWNVFPVEATTPDGYDPLTQARTEGTPSFDGNVWSQTWTVTELAPEEATAAYDALVARVTAQVGSLFDQADQFVVKAIVDKVGLTTEFQAYRESLFHPELFAGYPAATEYPTLPSNIFDANAPAPTDNSADHIAKYHVGDTPASTSSTETNYRGFAAVTNVISGSDKSINQILIYKYSALNTNAGFTDPNSNDTDYDTLRLTDIPNSDLLCAFNLYGNSEDFGLSDESLLAVFQAVVDNIFYDFDTLITDLSVMKDNFYNKFDDVVTNVVGDVLDKDRFEFFVTGNPTDFNEVPFTTNNDFPGLSFSLKYKADRYAFNGWGNSSGTNPTEGTVVTVLGTDLGGTSPENDCTMTWNPTTNDWILSGTSMGVIAWPNEEIDDGGSDQYDGGNRIVTDLNNMNPIPYNGGDVADGSSYFGSNSSYVACYKDAVFAFIALGANGINTFGYDGGCGADGDGGKVTKALFASGSIPAVKTATRVVAGTWEIKEVNGELHFVNSGTTVIVLRTDGQLDAIGNINSNNL